MANLPIDRRLTERVLVEGGFIISLGIDSTDQQLPGIVQDVSEQGMKVIVSKYLPLGTQIAVVIDGRREQLEVVRRQKTARIQGTYTCALVTKDPRSDLLRLLRRSKSAS